ncbi:MAG: metallophosphoesterase family protein [Planctomycetota bacterium]
MAELAGSTPAQWRLVWKSDPSTSATLCWSTAVAGSRHEVLLREAGVDDGVSIVAIRNGKYSATTPTLFFHHAKLEKLKPATKYYVTLVSDGQRSPEMYFLTAPAEDLPVSFLFGADSRSGRKARQHMNRMLAGMVTESYLADRVPILALAHGGDYIYDGRDLRLWSQWMSDHELTVGPDGRMLPIIPARGNHDGGEVFNEVFAFPPNDKNYYSTDLGPQLRLVTLNTEISVAGDQQEWLQAELASARPVRRWLVAQYHRPAFPAVKQSWLNLVHWVPLFESYDLDLACEGDGHNIKRSVPIRNFKVDPTGVVYIGEGGLGVGQRSPKRDRWYLTPPQAKTGQGHHVQLLTFDRQQYTYRVVMLDGAVFDESTRPVRETYGAPSRN